MNERHTLDWVSGGKQFAARKMIDLGRELRVHSPLEICICSKDVPSSQLVGIDGRCAVEMVRMN